MVTEILLSEFGLVTVDEAAKMRGCAVRTVQKWVADGILPALCAGKGRRGVYLLRAFTPPPRGRPAPSATRSSKRRKC